MRNKIMRTVVFVGLCLVGAGLTAAGAYAWNFLKSEHPDGYNECLKKSGGRADFGSVQYACKKAYDGNTPPGDGTVGQNACSGWLGPVGNSVSRSIRIYSNSQFVPVMLYGMCTDKSDTTSNLIIEETKGGSPVTWITGYTKNLRRSGTWGVAGSGTGGLINVEAFKNGATVTTDAEGNSTYSRTVYIHRWHSSGTSNDWDEATISLTTGVTPPPPEPIEYLCGSWGSVVGGTTNVVMKIKNMAERFIGTSDGEWKNYNGEDAIYAKPTDRIAWHTCYYPGVQSEWYKRVAEVRGIPGIDFKGYEKLPDDRCLAEKAHVDLKQLAALMGAKWQNYYRVYGGIPNDDSRERKPAGKNELGESIGMDYLKTYLTGQQNGRWYHNESSTIPIDAGSTYTENTMTGTPINVTYPAPEVPPFVDIVRGSCYKGVTENGVTVDKTKLDGSNVYPICPSTAIFKDPTTGAYFDSNYPDILGKVPEVPATATTPKVEAYNCWKPITGKPKSCKDCCNQYGCDADCMKRTGCNTCNGNPNCTENCCTCTDDFQCFQCRNEYDNVITIANVKEGPAKDKEIVKIPYNYENDTGVEVANKPVYAGETITVNKIWAQVMPKCNSVTKDCYATKVPSAEVKLIGYVSSMSNGGDIEAQVVSGDLCDSLKNELPQDQKNSIKQCATFPYGSGRFSMNEDGNLGGSPAKNLLDKAEEYNAFDASAGDYMCMVSAIYPARSADNDKDMGTDGNGKWKHSEPSCAPIAKRPTFQVWGGDMYSRVNVENDFANKRNVYAGYYNSWNNLNGFKKTGDSKTHFGSWVQEGLVLGGIKGSTKTIASGAALGNNGTKNTAYTGNGGDLCDKMVPLTFANNCNNDGTAVSANMGSLSGDPKSLINYWISNPDGGEISGTHDLDYLWNSGIKQESATKTEIRHLKINGSLNITGGEMGNSRTLLIDYKDATDGKVTISRNIKYGTGFNSLGQVPKLIIYAKNIDISCNVTEIDAILIATNKVNTCVGGGDDNDSSESRANQLKIVGTVITGNGITLGRTYGAAAWGGDGYANGQGEAAEIFDYDSTILMWSEHMSSSAQTDTLQTVYQHELAPRY